jgi:hypothetical protein
LTHAATVRLSALLALPPFDAPSSDSATVAGFFTRSGSAFGLSHFSPMIFSMTALAKRTGVLRCRFRFLWFACSGLHGTIMARFSHGISAKLNDSGNEHWK